MKHDERLAQVNTEGKRDLNVVRRAVRGLRALQQEIGNRKGFKPISDKEIKDAINEGRR